MLIYARLVWVVGGGCIVGLGLRGCYLLRAEIYRHKSVALLMCGQFPHLLL